MSDNVTLRIVTSSFPQVRRMLVGAGQAVFSLVEERRLAAVELRGVLASLAESHLQPEGAELAV